MEEVTVSSTSFKKLAADVKVLFSKNDPVRELTIKICILEFYDIDTTALKLSIEIDNSFNCNISVNRRLLAKAHSIWDGQPVIFDSVETVVVLIDRLEHFHVCRGNFESEYSDLVPIGSALSNRNEVGITAYREGDFGALTSSGKSYSSTIRSTHCTLLTDQAIKWEQWICFEKMDEPCEINDQLRKSF